MTSSSSFRKIASLLVAVMLAFPLATAAQPRLGSSLGDLFDQLWGSLISIWSENGCTIDPSGCPSGNGGESPDEGCTIDPDGRCLPGAAQTPAVPPRESTDEGCTIDPNGGCRSGS